MTKTDLMIMIVIMMMTSMIMSMLTIVIVMTNITELKTRWGYSPPSLPWILLLQYSPGSPTKSYFKANHNTDYFDIPTNIAEQIQFVGILVLHNK